MKQAQVYCARVTGASFSWKWRSADGKHESENAFDYYHDCLEDARKHGYTAEFFAGKSTAAKSVPAKSAPAPAPATASGKRAK